MDSAGQTGEEPGYLGARLAGLALTVACWFWASRARLGEAGTMALVWVTPLLAFPIARWGRRRLDAYPTPRRVKWITVLVHYGMGIALGSSMFAALGALFQRPTLEAPVLGEAVRVLVLLTGLATFLTVLNLAVRGLGAPFAVKLSRHLATDWMYARTRNPMIFCTLAWFLCLGIRHQSAWFVVYLAVSIAPGLLYFVRVYEERELGFRFGPAYAEYRARTPFFWPRVRVSPTDTPAEGARR